MVSETRAGLDELAQHQQLLAESWRCRLATARSTLAQLADVREDDRAVRAVRALVATAAREEALAALFESRLVMLSDQQLCETSARLEERFASLRGASAQAAAHLAGATEDLLAELTAEFAARRVGAGRGIRYQERFADDLVAAMRAHGNRIEQLLLELAEAADATVGAPAGGLLPTRESHVPPRADLGQISFADVASSSDEVSRAVGRSIDLFRDRLARQVEEAIETLRIRLDCAAQWRVLGDQAARQHADELARAAQHLTRLSQRLDRMAVG
jgi:hypothetical protein